MSKQPEALRLADELTIVHNGHADEGPSTFSEAAAELRRLHEANKTICEKARLVTQLVKAGKSQATRSFNPVEFSNAVLELAAEIAKATGEQQ